MESVLVCLVVLCVLGTKTYNFETRQKKPDDPPRCSKMLDKLTQHTWPCLQRKWGATNHLRKSSVWECPIFLAQIGKFTAGKPYMYVCVLFLQEIYFPTFARFMFLCLFCSFVPSFLRFLQFHGRCFFIKPFQFPNNIILVLKCPYPSGKSDSFAHGQWLFGILFTFFLGQGPC